MADDPQRSSLIMPRRPHYTALP